MTRRPVIAPWVDTGRYAPPPPVERLRDLRALAECLRSGRTAPPLVARWFVGAVDELDRLLEGGARPNLHRLLGLPDRSPQAIRRRVRQHERDELLRAVAASLPAQLAPWPRAAAVAALIADTDATGPEATRSALMQLRLGLLGRPPSSVRSIHRIIARGH